MNTVWTKRYEETVLVIRGHAVVCWRWSIRNPAGQHTRWVGEEAIANEVLAALNLDPEAAVATVDVRNRGV